MSDGADGADAPDAADYGGDYGGGYAAGGYADGMGEGHGDGDHSHGDGSMLFLKDAPRGWLVAGIDPGLTYPKETYGHALAFGHSYGVEKVAPKGTSSTALMAHAIALDVAKKNGGVDSLAPYDMGYLWQHPAFSGITPPEKGHDKGRRLNLPGIGRSNTIIEVLAWPHGVCTPQDEWRRVAERLGLSRLDLRRELQLADINKTEYTLLSNSPFGDPKNVANRSNGWHRNADGKTHFWREFYQLKECGRTGWPWNRPAQDDLYGTFLAVFGVTYTYERTKDCETRIAFAVYSLPYNEHGHWTYKWAQIRKHRETAEASAKAMQRYLHLHQAPCTAISERMAIRLEDLEPAVPNVVPVPRKPVSGMPLPPSLPTRLPQPEGPDVEDKK
jgi:hypothetical protein